MEDSNKLKTTRVDWGQEAHDHHGYASREERLEKRGMDDWELVEKIPESQQRIPKWFIAIIAVVLVAAFGLSFPFWGDRPDMERPWLTMGHLFAVGYLLLFGGVIYFMTRLYGSSHGGRLDADGKMVEGIDDDIEMPKRKRSK